MNYFLKYKKQIIISVSTILILVSYVIFNKQLSDKSNIIEPSNNITLETTSSVNNKVTFYVDVKGAVIKPGVYEFNEGDMVIDAISSSGGLKKSAITSNINLSKKLVSEMVVYIYTKSELSNHIDPCSCETIEINDCPLISSDLESSSIINNTELININKDSLELLMTLKGVGETKAKAIIAYREIIPFNKIEDLMNVSGFGEASFAKIKDYITV